MIGGTNINISNSKATNSGNLIKILIAVGALVILFYLIGSYCNSKKTTESFANDSSVDETSLREPFVNKSGDYYNNSNINLSVDELPENAPQRMKTNNILKVDVHKKAKECANNLEKSNISGNNVNLPSRSPHNVKQDPLCATDLLPKDTNSKWAQVNPVAQGELQDQNFLEAGFHIGTNTVGQTLRNPNLQLRSEPPCPQVKVSPWMQSTMEADISRRPMEIGSC